ncbi:hypothetical protein SAMN04489719_0893 [Agrococcus carbonis]|uniref:Uncharacterized protein n=1 Tax=Agrococcus carbonis TaxID=684552 RepID=A0A1H1M9S6_9MICO|nr:hypothetical protein SAMN04489719_0893 [Agrococcus carbonis]
MLAAEWWWVAPAGAGAGAIGWAGLRRRGPAGRRLALQAALHDVRESRRAVTRASAERKLARAELLRAQAERSADRGVPGAVPDARRRVQAAERAVKAAAADLRARHAQVRAACASMPDARAPIEAMPLALLRAEHDAVTSRWIAYETDPAKAIECPAMSDASSPALQAFLREQRTALELRPASAGAALTPAEFAAYRDAVRRASRAFDAAESAARRGAGREGRTPQLGEWGALAQDLLDTAHDVIARTADAWQRGDHDGWQRRT